MAKYRVYCTQVWNGDIVVDAESKEDAVQKVQESIDDVDFSYGEATADYAEETTDEE